MSNNQQFHTVRGYELLNEKKLLSSSMEDYLEMIYRNSLKENYIRINTLAKLLNVKASSASKMVQKLSRLKLLKYEKYGIIALTENGKIIGEFLLKRHNTIQSFLKKLGSNKNILVETELIEHNISIETLENIELLNTFLETNPDIVERFEQFKKTYNKNQ